MLKRKSVVIVGGGTGSFVVLSGLKALPYDLSAIISVADSGGSTGRLRDEFGFLPVGDLRQALAALALEKDQSWIQKILLYRFSKGSGLEGHNLGNLILTALQDMTHSTAAAMEIASTVFKLQGHIYPSTEKNVQLVVEYSDGTIIIGEHHLNPGELGGKKIKSVRLSPHASLYAPAAKALINADAIVIGPGDLYASLLPNLIVKGIHSALKQSKAKIIYIPNLMTSFTQTHGLTAAGHVEVIERVIRKKLDYIILNNAKLGSNSVKPYQEQHEHPVLDDLSQKEARVIRTPLVRTAITKPLPGDTLKRSYVRHDSIKLAKVIHEIIH